jgi:hypothetical protein
MPQGSTLGDEAAASVVEFEDHAVALHRAFAE